MIKKLVLPLIIFCCFLGSSYADAANVSSSVAGEVCVNAGSAIAASITSVIAIFSMVANFVPPTSSVGKVVHFLALNITVS